MQSLVHEAMPNYKAAELYRRELLSSEDPEKRKLAVYYNQMLGRKDLPPPADPLAARFSSEPKVREALGQLRGDLPVPSMGHELSRAARAWGRGVTLKDDYSASQNRMDLAGQPTTFGGKARGLASDLIMSLVDPTMGLGFGTVTKTGKAAKVMGTMAPRVGEQMAGGQRALVSFLGEPLIGGAKVVQPLEKLSDLAGATQIGRGVGNALGTAASLVVHKAATTPVARAVQAAQENIQHGIGNLVTQKLTRTRTIHAMAKEAGTTYDDAGNAIESMMEAGRSADLNIATTQLGKIDRKLAKLEHRTGRIPTPRPDWAEAWDLPAERGEDLLVAREALGARIGALRDGVITPDVIKDVANRLGDEFAGQAEAIGNSIQESYAEWFKLHGVKGFPLAELTGAGYGGSHLIVPEARREIDRLMFQGQGRQWPVKHRAMYRRALTSGYTIPEANDIVARAELGGLNHFFPELTEKYGGKVFTLPKFLVNDPAHLEYVYGAMTTRMAGLSDLVGAVKKMDGAYEPGYFKTMPEADALAATANLRTVRINGLEKQFDGWLFEPEMADEIEKYLTVIADPRKMSEAEQAFRFLWDAPNVWWKAWTLAPFVSYHVRNALGNKWNMLLGGFKDPTKWDDAARLQLAHWEPGSRFATGFRRLAAHALNGTNAEEAIAEAANAVAQKYGFKDSAELWDTLSRKGVSGHAFVMSELGEAERLVAGVRQGDVARAVGNVVGPNAGPVRGGRTVGGLVEDNDKIAFFLHELSDPDIAELPLANRIGYASERVNAFLFDYNPAKLTGFERGLRRYAMPFLTWTRYNFPLQLRGVLQQPGKYAALTRGTQAWGGFAGEPTDERWMSERLARSFPIHVGGTAEKASYLPGLRTIPAAELQSITDIPGALLDLLGPVPKFALAAATKRDPYTGQPIAGYEGERKSLLGMNMNPWLAYGLRSAARPISEADWILRAVEGKYPISTSVARLAIGKAQEYEPTRERRYRGYDIDDQIRLANRDMIAANRNHDRPEAERLMRLIADLRAQKAGRKPIKF
jgi:hypothetical protein